MRSYSLTSLSLLMALLTNGCSEATNSTGTISKKIGEIVHTPGAKELDLRVLPTFGWAYFYATKPGVTRDEVCKMIGAGRSVCGRIIRIERAPADHVYLLFGLNGNLTYVELHAVENGSFDFDFTENGHPKEKSVFAIRRASAGTGKDRVFLEPK